MNELDLEIKNMRGKSTRDLVAYLLIKNKGRFVSGSRISAKLSISRVAVHKVINELESLGYLIDKRRGKGYKLLKIPNIPFSPIIDYRLEARGIEEVSYFYRDKVASTQSWVMKMKEKCDSNWVACCAGEQVKGRGRLERNWSSPRGGIWMSFWWNKSLPADRASSLSLCSAYSVIKTLASLYGIEAKIKWPNDIILSNRKLAGVLVTAKSEVDRLTDIVIGVGLNANNGFDNNSNFLFEPTSLYQELSKEVDLKKIIIFLIKHLVETLNSCFEDMEKCVLDLNNLLWKKDEPVVVTSPDGKKIKGVVKSINPDGTLLIKEGDKKRYLSTGEIVRIS